MTLREKLQIEHPECIDEKWHGGCKDCPHRYGYKDMKECECDSKTVNEEICRKCWDQKYEGELTPQEKMIERLTATSDYWRKSYQMNMDDAHNLRVKLSDIEDHIEKKTGTYNSPFFNTDSYIKSEFDKLFSSRKYWRAAFIGLSLGNLAFILQLLI